MIFVYGNFKNYTSEYKAKLRMQMTSWKTYLQQTRQRINTSPEKQAKNINTHFKKRNSNKQEKVVNLISNQGTAN